MRPSIDDHGAIGDGRAAALVTPDGVIDWLCWPRFDSPALFAALLDPARGGHWRLGPRGPARIERRYLPGTNVLETRAHRRRRRRRDRARPRRHFPQAFTHIGLINAALALERRRHLERHGGRRLVRAGGMRELG